MPKEVTSQEVTCSFLHNYLSPITTGKLCEVVLAVTFTFDIFDKFEFTSKRKKTLLTSPLIKC